MTVLNEIITIGSVSARSMVKHGVDFRGEAKPISAVCKEHWVKLNNKSARDNTVEILHTSANENVMSDCC